MIPGRLPARLEVSALLRRIEADGGFATVLHSGDASGGSLLLIVGSRGRHVGCLERVLGPSGGYEWRSAGPAESAGADEVPAFLAKRLRFDPDLWAVELDIAEPERFIAETTRLG
ncbi:MAG TPA: DUF1491 family protein [Sphingomicrobium sp.]|nr:DUF1491 family protein [Sphingomicrobium sp.]